MTLAGRLLQVEAEEGKRAETESSIAPQARKQFVTRAKELDRQARQRTLTRLRWTGRLPTTVSWAFSMLCWGRCPTYGSCPQLSGRSPPALPSFGLRAYAFGSLENLVGHNKQSPC